MHRKCALITPDVERAAGGVPAPARNPHGSHFSTHRDACRRNTHPRDGAAWSSAAALIFALVLMRQDRRNLTPVPRRRSSAKRRLRGQRDLRAMPSRRSKAVARLAAQPCHGPRLRQHGARRFLGNASFDYNGVHSRFFRDGKKFLVETDGADGKLATFEVKYTFGIDPLQQYLVAFPDGRIQALSLAWDTRPKDKGGQRWFHLYPNRGDRSRRCPALDQAEPELELHVRGVSLDRVRKNYDAGQRHMIRSLPKSASAVRRATARARAMSPGRARSRAGGHPVKPKIPTKACWSRSMSAPILSWLPDPRTGKPQRRIAPAILRKEVETCGLCHARRAALSEDWVPGHWLSDTHVVAPLSRGLYFADGQMQDEVYNYGSFKQSRMFAAGVTCSDCHEPHAAKLRAEGDNVCLQCHGARPTRRRRITTMQA